MKRSLVKLTVFMGLAVIGLTGYYGLVRAQEAQIEDKPFISVYKPDRFKRADVVVKKANGEELHFDVELALTPEEQSIGLMNRKSLGENEGMLFIFGNVRNRIFWMKDTLIPLDIIFLHSNGEIHHIHSNAKPQSHTHITSQQDSRAVLELPGGTAAKMGIENGDFVIHDVFRNTNLQQ